MQCTRSAILINQFRPSVRPSSTSIVCERIDKPIVTLFDGLVGAWLYRATRRYKFPMGTPLTEALNYTEMGIRLTEIAVCLGNIARWADMVAMDQ